MKFLAKDGCEAYIGRLGPVDDILDWRKLSYLKKKTDFFYDSLANASRIAEALVTFLRDFTSCLLWTHGLIFGDRTQIPDAPLHWREYGHWRYSCGAPGSLYDFPGQVFEPGEGAQLARAIEFTIRIGADAAVVPRPTPTIIHLSHDDLISVHARANPVGLHSLEKLGLRQFRH
jgi:hypothetical protein